MKIVRIISTDRQTDRGNSVLSAFVNIYTQAICEVRGDMPYETARMAFCVLSQWAVPAMLAVRKTKR